VKTLDDKAVTRVRSLISLLSDEDDSIYNTVRQHLMETGVGALPLLEDYLNTEDAVLRQRVKEVFETISGSAFKELWRTFLAKSKSDPDLEEGALMIAKFAYPRSDMRIYSDLLNFYATEFQSRLDPTGSADEIAGNIGHFFSVEKGFLGNEADYYDPDNHFIHKVLETKKGVPITLSVVYMLVLRRLNFPVHGIGLPGHFIIRYDFGQTHVFADPFNAGRIITEKECEARVSQMGYTYKKQYLEPVTNKQILERMLRNLLLVYERQNESNKVQSIIECIDILNLIV